MVNIFHSTTVQAILRFKQCSESVREILIYTFHSTAVQAILRFKQCSESVREIVLYG